MFSTNSAQIGREGGKILSFNGVYLEKNHSIGRGFDFLLGIPVQIHLDRFTKMYQDFFIAISPFETCRLLSVIHFFI